MVTTAPPPFASALLAKSAAAAKDDLPGGLTSDDARRRLAKFGPNAMPDTTLHPLRMALEKFWAPVPWMLEAAIVLEVVLGKYKAVLRVVRNLAAFNGVLIVMMVGYAYYLEMPPAEIIPLVRTAVLGSIPVALPATFTLASVLGARALAKLGVLPTRLSAVYEAATMDVLCADKLLGEQDGS
jgi:magnesium-transporting ATPase (P-type)